MATDPFADLYPQGTSDQGQQQTQSGVTGASRASSQDPFSDLYPKGTSAIASTFGYNDPQDNGVGAWNDITNDPNVHGVSLPISVLRSHFGDENAAHNQLVRVTNPDTGQSIVAPIIDKGPSERLKDRIDLTHATNQAIGGTGLTPVEYSFVDRGTSTPQKQINADPFADLYTKGQQANQLPQQEQTGKTINLPAMPGYENFFKQAAAQTAAGAIQTAGGFERAGAAPVTDVSGINAPFQRGATTQEATTAFDTAIADKQAALDAIQGIVKKQGFSTAEYGNQINDLQREIGDLQAQKEETLKLPQYASDVQQQALIQERKQLGQQAGALSEQAAGMFPALGVSQKDTSIAAQLGRGFGNVVGLAPAMLTGPLALPTMAVMGGSQAYGEGYDAKVAELKQQGVTDQAQLDAAGHKAGSEAALATVPALAAYTVGGELTSKATSALLKGATPLVKGLVGGTAAAGVNLATSAGIRAAQGQNAMPTIEQAVPDILFGGIHGLGAGFEARAKAKENAKLGGPAPEVAPSTVPGVDSKEAAIISKADDLHEALPPPGEVTGPTINIPAATPEELNRAKISDLVAQQQIDALQKPAEALAAPTVEPTGEEPSQPIENVDPNNIIPPHLIDKKREREVVSMANSMKTNGWLGRPLLVVDDEAITGSHRLAAAKQANISVPIVKIPEDVVNDFNNWLKTDPDNTKSLDLSNWINQDDEDKLHDLKRAREDGINGLDSAINLMQNEVNNNEIIYKSEEKPAEAPVAEEQPKVVKLTGFGKSDSEAGSRLIDSIEKETEENQLDPRERIVNRNAAIDVEDLGGIARIHSIRAFERGVGAGKDALNLIIRLADQEEVSLVLDTEKFTSEGLTNQQLKDWYSRNGFVEQEDGSMIREPKQLTEEPSEKEISPESKVSETSGIPPVEGVSAETKPEGKAKEGTAPAQGEGTEVKPAEAQESQSTKNKYGPPSPQEAYAKRAYDALTKNLGRPATEGEIANAVAKKFPGITSKEIGNAYEKASGKAKPEPPQAVTPTTTGEETPEMISIRKKDQNDQVRRGLLTAVVPAGTRLSGEQVLQKGRANLNAGADPYEALERAKNGDPDGIATAKAYDQILAKQVNDTLKKYGADSEQYKSAVAKRQEYYEGIREAGTKASEALASFQGETDLTNVADMTAEFIKNTGQEPSKSQLDGMQKKAELVEKTINDAETTSNDWVDAMDNSMSDVEVKTPESVEDARDQVGDLSDSAGKKAKAEIERLNKELEQTKKDLEEIKQARETNQDASALKEYYEAKIKDLQDQLDKVPKYGKEVFEQARKIVDRWKADAKEAEKLLSKQLSGQLGTTPDISIVATLARIIRGQIGELGLDFAESSKLLLDKFGDKIKPYLKDAWDKAHELIKGEVGGEKAIKTVKSETKAKAKIKAKPVSKMSPAEKSAESLRKRIEQAQKKIDDINNGKVSTPKDVEKVTNDEIKRLEEEYKKKQDELKESRLVGKQRENLLQPRVEEVGQKLNPEQAKTLWETAKKFYLDKGERDIDKMINDMADDFGLTPKQIREAFASQKGVRNVTDKMYLAQIARRDALNNARMWLVGEQANIIQKIYGKAAARAFKLAIFGHGTAFLGTHAPSVRYTNPILSFKAWLQGFKYSFYGKNGRIKNYVDNIDLINRPTWRVANEAGLENDPFSHSSENPIRENSQNVFGRALDVITGGRGFDALYHLRQEMFEKRWNKLSITQKTPEMAKIISEQTNNATGFNKGGSIVNSPVVKALLFAAKLVKSRLNWMIADPIKMLGTYTKMATGQRTTLAERMGANFELVNKIKFMSGLVAALSVNQLLLQMSGSDQKINFLHPREYDWLAYKGFGYQLQTVGAITRIARLLFQESHDAFGELSRFEKAKGRRSDIMVQDFMKYIKSGLSPLARDIAVAVDRKDYVGNVVPWSNDQPDRGRRKLTWSEYIVQNFSPIPISEASTQKEGLPAVIKAGTAVLRGDRIETPQDLEEYKKSMQSKARSAKSSSDLGSFSLPLSNKNESFGSF